MKTDHLDEATNKKHQDLMENVSRACAQAEAVVYMGYFEFNNDPSTIRSVKTTIIPGLQSTRRFYLAYARLLRFEARHGISSEDLSHAEGIVNDSKQLRDHVRMYRERLRELGELP